MRKLALMIPAALLAGLPALAQAPNTTLAKFPTPPPAVTAENSVIGPSYADPPEAVANPAVPQGDLREFILYSEDSKIYPGIVRIENEISAKRDPYGNRLPAPDAQVSKPGRYERHVYVYVPKQVAPNAP